MAEGNGSGANGGAPPATRLEVQLMGEAPHATVLLVEYGLMSQHTTRLSPELADNVAQLLTTAARRARSGLVLPPNE